MNGFYVSGGWLVLGIVCMVIVALAALFTGMWVGYGRGYWDGGQDEAAERAGLEWGEMPPEIAHEPRLVYDTQRPDFDPGVLAGQLVPRPVPPPLPRLGTFLRAERRAADDTTWDLVPVRDRLAGIEDLDVWLVQATADLDQFMGRLLGQHREVDR